ncbi:MAG: hypothetical protein ACRDPA_11295, partial [Solirubrobacteraceae bacterium]
MPTATHNELEGQLTLSNSSGTDCRVHTCASGAVVVAISPVPTVTHRALVGHAPELNGGVPLLVVHAPVGSAEVNTVCV